MLCNVLCFAVNKYGKTAVKLLKSSLTDFYSVEVLADAKKQLAEDIDELNLSTKRPYVPSRRDGDGRIEREANDIVSLLIFVDEQKLLDKLPTYVCDDPDDIPSLRLYDGELNVIMRKLNDMNINLAEYASVLAAIGQQVRAIQVCSHPASSRMTAALPDVGGDIDRSLIDRNTGETTAGIPQPVPGESESSADWATAASTPFNRGNKFAVLSTITEDNTNGDQFTVVRSRRAVKRARQQSSPSHSSSQQQQQQTQPSRKSTLLGKAATGRGSVLSAAKSIRKRAVFCVDNVSTSCCVNDIRAFVSSQSVDVLTCFEVKPRRRRNESNTADRKAFRLCVYEDDRHKLLNEAIWPDSIKVSEWYFKHADTGNNINVAAGGGEGTASASSSSAAAAAVAATPADTDVAVDMAMSDDTIVTAYDINSISDGN